MELNVVLVESLYSRNVGYVSRAMANMGANRLILINCHCEYDLDAREGAAGAQTHLVTATRYSSWTEFFANEKDGIRIAFSARQKKETDDLPFEQRLAELFNDERQDHAPYYLIFGREDCGLSNDDVEYAHYICALPTFGSFKSFNLAHAVMMALYIFQSTSSRVAPAITDKSSGTSTTPEQTGEKFFFPSEAIHEWLTTLGFQIGDRRTDAYQVLKRILLSNRATPKELRILEAVIHQTVRKLKI